MSVIPLPYDDQPYAPSVAEWVTRAEHGRPLAAERPRNGLPVRGYAYRGTGADTLTPDMDDEPPPPPLTRRQERMQALAQLRLHHGNEPDKVPYGCVTAAQAAEMLGVTSRTIERYKAELAGRTTC